ncbi:MAG TPA: FtsX-like permease family protein [Treponemataceae bacterium]|nr:FtsX-like permease family protein [Treponemataceae bacterium]
MNVFRLSLLYIRSRKLESALGIVGIVLGVATLAGTLSLISSYESYYEIFSRSPESRQLTVSQSSRVRVTDSPAILIGTTELENIRFSGSEAKAALEVCPDLDSFYEAGYRKFFTGLRSSQTRTGYSGAGGGGAGGTGPGAALLGGAGGGSSSGIQGSRPGAVAIADSTIENPLMESIPGAMVSGGFFNAWSLQAEFGDIFSDSGDNSGVPGAVVGSTLAENLFETVNQASDLLGKKIILNNTVYSIIGVLKKDAWNSSDRNTSFNDMIFIPSFALRSGSMDRSMYRTITYSIKSSGSPSQAAMQAENYFNSIYGEGAVVAQANLDLFQKEITKRQRILSLMAILASASAITAAINLFNLITSRVMRRRRPIAIMRAIGASNKKVFAQIMLESALIGLAGSFGGMLLSPVVVSVLGSMLENSSTGQNIPVSIHFSVLAIVGFGALCVSLIFAAIPAKNGASLEITDALRSD